MESRKTRLWRGLVEDAKAQWDGLTPSSRFADIARDLHCRVIDLRVEHGAPRRGSVTHELQEIVMRILRGIEGSSAVE